MRMTEDIKTILAMIVGGATSMTTFISGSINNFNITMANIPVLSIEYATMLLTALLVGASGALGGLIIREGHKYVIKSIKGFTKPKNDNNKLESNNE